MLTRRRPHEWSKEDPTLPACRRLRALAALACFAASGCTTLREVPREDYAAPGERGRIVVDTRDGGHHEFDYARVQGDTLTGFRQRDTEGEFEELHSVAIPLEAITHLSTRRLDWYRTALAGGAAVAGIIVAVLSRQGGEVVVPAPDPCGPRGCPE
jgi:hypothetical protein